MSDGWATCEKCGRNNCLGDQLPSCLNLQVKRLTAERDEARQVARDYRNGILRLDWYEWHEETVLADEAALAEKYPWLKEGE
jgi:hypothetical protein